MVGIQRTRHSSHILCKQPENNDTARHEVHIKPFDHSRKTSIVRSPSNEKYRVFGQEIFM